MLTAIMLIVISSMIYITRRMTKNWCLLLLKLEGLEKYVDLFGNAGITFWQFVVVSERKLIDIGVDNVDDRRRILDIARRARAAKSEPAPVLL